MNLFERIKRGISRTLRQQWRWWKTIWTGL
jgi:hypothetical protein